MTPLKYYLTQQPRFGDAHVFGAPSRFLTARVRGTLDAFGGQSAPATEDSLALEHVPPVDLRSRMRAFWD